MKRKKYFARLSL